VPFSNGAPNVSAEDIPLMIILSAPMTRAVMTALSDEFSRRIISSTVDRGKTIQEISLEQAVPRSTCYRRASDLANHGLLVVERIMVTDDGKRYAVYRSSFRSVQMASELGVISATATLNVDVADKFHRLWAKSGRTDNDPSPDRWPR
jgi:hypothetical protein